jgi:hypothetical protein
MNFGSNETVYTKTLDIALRHHGLSMFLATLVVNIIIKRTCRFQGANDTWLMKSQGSKPRNTVDKASITHRHRVLYTSTNCAARRRPALKSHQTRA